MKEWIVLWKMTEVKPDPVPPEEVESRDSLCSPSSLRHPISVRPMVLMGTGPTNPTQRVTEALSKPFMGLYQPEFHQVFLIVCISNQFDVIVTVFGED